MAVTPAADGEVERSGPEMVKVPAEQLEDLSTWRAKHPSSGGASSSRLSIRRSRW
ncbi:hypothetical protein F2S71_04865 [Pseudomonas syringae pv. actinidiae]|nr:hypothetical protein [Pseudomonas syringae pv. actinidiae]